MKKFITLFFAFFIAFSFVACQAEEEVIEEEEVVEEVVEDSGIMIPDISGTDEDVAKNVLSANGFIPTFQYEYHNNVAEGLTILTLPKAGSYAEINTKVTVLISKGPYRVTAKNSIIEWTHISTKGQDDWKFYSPNIEGDILYIECMPTFAAKTKWKDTRNDGKLFGEASINDTFDKVIPISAKYEKQETPAGEQQHFTLEIPLSDLGVSRPTDMHLNLYLDDNKAVSIKFSMTW